MAALRAVHLRPHQAEEPRAMIDDPGIEKAKHSEQYQAFSSVVNRHYKGRPEQARAMAGKAWTLALKRGQVPPDLLTAVAALIPVLAECTDNNAHDTRRDMQTLAHHALRPAYSWMVVTLVCEPPDEDTGEPGAIIWSSAPLPEHGVGSIWEEPTHAERWQEIAPIVADHLRDYHECDPLTLEQIQKTLDAAKHRVYRTTNGSANTWLHYVDPDNDRPHSARVSMRRVRSADQSTHQGDET